MEAGGGHGEIATGEETVGAAGAAVIVVEVADEGLAGFGADIASEDVDGAAAGNGAGVGA
jgi:hypothetical protein